MQPTNSQTLGDVAIEKRGAVFVSIELSQSKWLVTAFTPGCSAKMFRRVLSVGNVAELLGLFVSLRLKAEEQSGAPCELAIIHEAGLDGFWLQRILVAEGLESHVVDPTSIAMPQRARRVKTDRVDGETLVRTLMAFKRGEPRVCAMVKVPSHEEEDRRRILRERKALVVERLAHVNRIEGLLLSQGIREYRPLSKDRRVRLDQLRTGDGRHLPPNLKGQISRELDRLEMVIDQIKIVEAERDALLAAEDQKERSVTSLLGRLRGIGPEFASVLWAEGFYRQFDNRRQIAAYAGLAPTPWQSGSIDRDQGVSKAGNARLRTTMVQVAWLWARHQPGSALTRWFQSRAAGSTGPQRKKAIIALARKLLVALWKYVTCGLVIEGAVLKAA